MDTILRALTDDECFRVVVFFGDETARRAVLAQRVEGAVAERLAEVVLATALVRETMAPGHRVQGILAYRAAKLSFVGDSHPDGTARGLVQGAPGPRLPDEAPLFQIMRTLQNGELHQGIVELSGGGVRDGLMQYMQRSEQVTTLVDVCPSGGYLVQLLPGAPSEGVRRMLEHARALPPILELLEAAPTADALLERLVGGVPFVVTGRAPHEFGCRCSEERVLDGLATLPRAEIQAMRDERKTFDVSCDFCHADYPIGPDALQRLLDVS